VDVWDASGQRLLGFLPYGPETPVDALAWAGPNRLITRGGGKVTGWEVPGPKAVFEFMGYVGAHALSPNRKWIALQYDKHLDVFDTMTGKPLGRADRANPGGKPWHGFAVAPDGLQLAAVEQVRDGTPNVWAVATWDLRTGQPRDAQRLFGGSAGRPGHHVQWLGPRMLLAGGSDVIDLDARAVTAVLGLQPDQPLPSPDGRYWGARPDRVGPNPNLRNPNETIIAIDLEEPVKSLPRLRPDDVVFREGTNVEVVSNTGDNGRDAVVRSQLGQMLGAEGFGIGGGGWRMVVTGQQTAGTGGSLETPAGGRIPIPGISGKVQLQDPAGEVVWEVPASGGWDRNRSKYKAGKEDLGPMGGSITHYNFGLRDPVAAMAEEAWDNFLEGIRSMNGYPRVMARVNGKVVRLPIAVPVPAK
jgi:hypothetical protein